MVTSLLTDNCKFVLFFLLCASYAIMFDYFFTRYALILLVVFQLVMTNVSLLGHLCGILSGFACKLLPLCWTLFKFFKFYSMLFLVS